MVPRTNFPLSPTPSHTTTMSLESNFERDGITVITNFMSPDPLAELQSTLERIPIYIFTNGTLETLNPLSPLTLLPWGSLCNTILEEFKAASFRFCPCPRYMI